MFLEGKLTSLRGNTFERINLIFLKKKFFLSRGLTFRAGSIIFLKEILDF